MVNDVDVSSVAFKYMCYEDTQIFVHLRLFSVIDPHGDSETVARIRIITPVTAQERKVKISLVSHSRAMY